MLAVPEICRMKDEQAQRRIIAAALFPLKFGSAVASPYEQSLADQYVAGTLTIYQSIELLEEHQRRQMSREHR